MYTQMNGRKYLDMGKGYISDGKNVYLKSDPNKRVGVTNTNQVRKR